MCEAVKLASKIYKWIKTFVVNHLQKLVLVNNNKCKIYVRNWGADCIKLRPSYSYNTIFWKIIFLQKSTKYLKIVLLIHINISHCNKFNDIVQKEQKL